MFIVINKKVTQLNPSKPTKCLCQCYLPGSNYKPFMTHNVSTFSFIDTPSATQLVSAILLSHTFPYENITGNKVTIK